MRFFSAFLIPATPGLAVGGIFGTLITTGRAVKAPIQFAAPLMDYPASWGRVMYLWRGWV